MARVLVVDDEPYMRSFLRRVLKRAGHHVDEAEGGDAALRQLRTDPVDVMITDLVMHTGRGIESITTCRKQFPNMVIIAISAHGAYLPVAKRLGAHHVLEKPFNNRALVDLVAKALLERSDVVK